MAECLIRIDGEWHHSFVPPTPEQITAWAGLCRRPLKTLASLTMIVPYQPEAMTFDLTTEQVRNLVEAAKRGEIDILPAALKELENLLAQDG